MMKIISKMKMMKQFRWEWRR